MAWTRRPHSGSRSPTTTTSAMPGCSLRAASTSAGKTLTAPVTIMSTLRSAMIEEAVLVQPPEVTHRGEAVAVVSMGFTSVPT